MNIEDIEQLIDKQIDNTFKINIFEYKLARIDSKLIENLKNPFLSSKNIQIILEYCTAHLIKKLIKYNQYINFNDNVFGDLRKIYAETLKDIIDGENLSKEEIEKNHFYRIRAFLLRTNPFLKQICRDGIKTFLNVEYSAKLQMNILGLNNDSINGLVLDIGCGESFNLINYLKKLGIQAYGLDHYRSNQKNIFKDDFLSFDYGLKKWHYIVSNMAFSNHFNQHLSFNDEEFGKYAKIYLRILNALAVGGKFIYAPSN